MGKDAETPLRILMAQADELDFTDPFGKVDVHDLRKPGFEISKLLSIIDFALASSADPDGLFNELKLSPADELKKKAPGVFQFEVKSGKETEFWYADMKGTGRIYPGKAPKKADVSLIVKDQDMVALALGQMSPQKAFLTGKIKVKGNLMLGLRMNDLLTTEVAKLSKL